jgi:hypothetical protein
VLMVGNCGGYSGASLFCPLGLDDGPYTAPAKCLMSTN